MAIPVHVIAGFLGSGKTTLMNHLLGARPADLRPAIIVNDFGDVALDGDLIDRSGYALKELPSGCVCCTLKGPLAETLGTFASEIAPDVILMETTGIAVPADIAAIFRSAELEPFVQIGNVVCVIDACSFLKYEPHFAILGIQVQQANTILLNKTDLVPENRLNATRNRIEYLCLPDSKVIETQHCKLDSEAIYQNRNVYFPVSRHSHTHDEFSSFSFESEKIASLEKLESLFGTLENGILRAKGIVRTDGGEKVVQWTLSGCEIGDWNQDVERSRLVFVGKDLRPEELEERVSQIFLA